jgi:hypothetical protein
MGSDSLIKYAPASPSTLLKTCLKVCWLPPDLSVSGCVYRSLRVNTRGLKTQMSRKTAGKLAWVFYEPVQPRERLCEC